MSHAKSGLTKLLKKWEAGDKTAFDEIFSLVYQELHKIVGNKKNAFNVSIQTTECIHEAYLRLMDQNAPAQNRAQFFAIAARVICRVLSDYNRARKAQKRGAGQEHIAIEDANIPVPCGFPDWLIFEEGLSLLENKDAKAAQAFQLRILVGLSLEETATGLQTSVPTIVRHVRFAKAFLGAHLLNT